VNVCVAKAEYAGKPEYISGIQSSMPGMEHGHGQSKHISNIAVCKGENLKNKATKKGQVWNLKGKYDFDQYPGMKDADGHWDEVMALDVLYVRQKGK
jgi:hypothetical protein